MFITTNDESFHLWWKKNLVKHYNASKYYGQDCTYWTHLLKKCLMENFCFFPASISSRVLQISRKSTGADCLHMVGRISILLCNLYGLKSPEKSNFKCSISSDTSIFFSAFNISFFMFMNLFKVSCLNIFFIALVTALRV